MNTPVSSQAPDLTLTFSWMVASVSSLRLQMTILCLANRATWDMSLDHTTYLILACLTDASALQETIWLSAEEGEKLLKHPSTNTKQQPARTKILCDLKARLKPVSIVNLSFTHKLPCSANIANNKLRSHERFHKTNISRFHFRTSYSSSQVSTAAKPGSQTNASYVVVIMNHDSSSNNVITEPFRRMQLSCQRFPDQKIISLFKTPDQYSSKKILHWANVCFSSHASVQPCRCITSEAFQAVYKRC